MEPIIRHDYIQQIEKYLGKELIIVLVGQRRVGKSYMMRQINSFKSQDSSNHVILIDKEKRQFDFIKTYQDYAEQERKSSDEGYNIGFDEKAEAEEPANQE